MLSRGKFEATGLTLTHCRDEALEEGTRKECQLSDWVSKSVNSVDRVFACHFARPFTAKFCLLRQGSILAGRRQRIEFDRAHLNHLAVAQNL